MFPFRASFWRCQVRGLQEELSKATAMSAAAAAAASASTTATATAEQSEASPSPSPGALDVAKTETTVFGELPTVALAVATAKDLGPRSGSVEAWVDDDSGSGLSPAQRKALELEGVERELENVREREQDSKGEAERLADELKRARWVRGGHCE